MHGEQAPNFKYVCAATTGSIRAGEWLRSYDYNTEKIRVGQCGANISRKRFVAQARYGIRTQNDLALGAGRQISWCARAASVKEFLPPPVERAMARRRRSPREFRVSPAALPSQRETPNECAAAS